MQALLKHFPFLGILKDIPEDETLKLDPAHQKMAVILLDFVRNANRIRKIKRKSEYYRYYHIFF